MGRQGRPRQSVKKVGRRAPAVLFVEDDVLLRSAFAEILRDLGYTVIEAANAEEAIGVFASGAEIDLVFSDVNLAGPTLMDGVELSRWIAAHHPGIPVMLTSADGRYSAQAARTAAAFLLKPYRGRDLALRVASLLGKPQG